MYLRHGPVAAKHLLPKLLYIVSCGLCGHCHFIAIVSDSLSSCWRHVWLAYATIVSWLWSTYFLAALVPLVVLDWTWFGLDFSTSLIWKSTSLICAKIFKDMHMLRVQRCGEPVVSVVWQVGESCWCWYSMSRGPASFLSAPRWRGCLDCRSWHLYLYLCCRWHVHIREYLKILIFVIVTCSFCV